MRQCVYSLFAGGKRVRPILALAAAESLGAPDQRTSADRGLARTDPYLFADPRRSSRHGRRRFSPGKPDRHKVYGEAIAILAGDGLLNMAFESFRPAPRCGVPASRGSVIRGDRDGLGRLRHGRRPGGRHPVRGQGDRLPDPRIYPYTQDRRTDPIISPRRRPLCASRKAQFAALTRYGEAVGLAFQIADDILDIPATGRNRQRCRQRPEKGQKDLSELLRPGGIPRRAGEVGQGTKSLQDFDRKADPSGTWRSTSLQSN